MTLRATRMARQALMTLCVVFFCVTALAIQLFGPKPIVPPPPLSRAEIALLMKHVSFTNNNTLIFTLVNKPLFRFLLLRRRALGPHQSSVERKTVLMCLDPDCMRACERHKMPICFQSSEFTSKRRVSLYDKEYININYQKFKFFELAVAQSEHSLMMDADTLLFRDPFEYILQRPQYTVQWQSEQATNGNCNIEANGGMLYIHRDARRFFPYFYRNEATILNASQMNETDQAYVIPSVTESGLAGCALPSKLFVGKCQYGRDGEAHFRHVVSYHANCASQKQKYRAMTRFLGFHQMATKGERPFFFGMEKHI